MNYEKKNLFENFISLGALQIISYIIPLITLPYLSRVLSVERFGLVFFAFAFMQYFIMLTDFGFGLSATREIAINRHNQKNISNIFNSVTISKFLLLLISFVILLLAIIYIDSLRVNWKIFLLSFLMVVGNAIYPVWFFQGMERMKYITFLNILSKTIFLALTVIFVKNDSQYWIVPLFNSLGFLVSGIIGFIYSIKKFDIKLYIPRPKSIIKQLKYSLEYFLSRISLSAYTNTNTFCLGFVGSNAMVGYYVAAEKIYNALSGLQNPLGQAIYPYVAKYKDILLYKKLFIVANIINIFICTFMFIFAKEFIVLFYGQNMIDAYKILRIFCCIVLLDFPSILLGFPLLGALGYSKEANGTVILGSIIHLVGLTIFYFTHNMNVYSIAYMVGITIVVVFNARLYFVIKYKLLKEVINE